jgi:hypothetical protein
MLFVNLYYVKPLYKLSIEAVTRPGNEGDGLEAGNGHKKGRGNPALRRHYRKS